MPHPTREGQPVPQVTFRYRENDGWKDITSDQLFKGRTVAFSLPVGREPRRRTGQRSRPMTLPHAL